RFAHHREPLSQRRGDQARRRDSHGAAVGRILILLVVIARESACEEFGPSFNRCLLLLPPKGGEGWDEGAGHECELGGRPIALPGCRGDPCGRPICVPPQPTGRPQGSPLHYDAPIASDWLKRTTS